jgi:Holliday junction resolvase
MKETEVQRDIIQYLHMRGIYAWRNNTMGVWDTKRKRYRANPNTLKGVSDILGLFNDGTFLAIECKSATGRLTPEQIEFMGEIERRKGYAICARSIEDVAQFLDVVQTK